VDRVIAAVLAGVIDGATYGLVALGIVLVYKATRVLNFAQAEIGTLCIYICWMLTSIHVPVLIAAAVALVAAAVMGAALEVTLRPLQNAPRLTVTVVTLGVATLLGSAEVVMFGPDPHEAVPLWQGSFFTLQHIDFVKGRVLALFITIALGFVLYAFFKRTLFGLGVLAAAQDQEALRLMGLPQNLVSIFVWSSGAVLAALAGIILAPTNGPFTPFFMFLFMIPALGAALIGGLTSLPGAFVGGILIGILENLSKFFINVPGAEFVAVFGAIILVLLMRPNGLLGAEA
jgi:branched-chain amino acid transport system permease protein